MADKLIFNYLKDLNKKFNNYLYMYDYDEMCKLNEKESLKFLKEKEYKMKKNINDNEPFNISKEDYEYVNHPKHYKGKKFEVIDIIEDYNLDFCLGNAIKYILRCGKKDNNIQELQKAIWYLQRKILEIEKEENNKKG